MVGDVLLEVEFEAAEAEEVDALAAGKDVYFSLWLTVVVQSTNWAAIRLRLLYLHLVHNLYDLIPSVFS